MAKIAAERLPALLRAGEPEREAASQELRDLLVRAALAYLLRQQYPVEAFGADTYESVAEDYAQASFTIILERLDTFRAESRFTTWAYSIVVNLIADEMRRRVWRRRPLTPEVDGVKTALISKHERAVEGVEIVAERHALWELVNGIIQRELTPRQRTALLGRIVEEKPLIVLADELGTNKDNIYKLLHDARKRLKRALNEQGITETEIFATFQVSGS